MPKLLVIYMVHYFNLSLITDVRCGPQVGYTSHGLVGKCETIHTKFLKMALGVRDNTSNNLVLNALSRSPTWTQWLKQCADFWNILNVADTLQLFYSVA